MQIEKGYKSPQRNLRYVHSKMAGKNSVYYIRPAQISTRSRSINKQFYQMRIHYYLGSINTDLNPLTKLLKKPTIPILMAIFLATISKKVGTRLNMRLLGA